MYFIFIGVFNLYKLEAKSKHIFSHTCSPCQISSTTGYTSKCWHGQILLMHNVIYETPCRMKWHINILLIVHAQDKSYKMVQPCQGQHMT